MMQKWVTKGTAPIPHLRGPTAGPFVSGQSWLEHQSGRSEHCQSPGCTGLPESSTKHPLGFTRDRGSWLEAHGQWEDFGFRKQASRLKRHASWPRTVAANAYRVPQALVRSFLNLHHP